MISKIKISLQNVATAGAMLAIGISGTGLLGIISIVYNVTGWKMPNWLAWSLVGATSISVIVSAISTVGGVVIAPSVAKVILASDSVGL